MNKFNKIFAIQWHVTDRCDQKCGHCYIYGKGRKVKRTPELDFDECCSVIENCFSFCKRMDCKLYLSITGGDPLLFPLIWELFDFLHQKEVKFAILGNPFHLDQEVAHKLYRLGCFSYQMSLDGLRQTHDEIRKAGSFEATLKAFEHLKKANIKTVVMTTVSKLNYKEVPGLIRVVVKNGIDVFGFARYCPSPEDVEMNIKPRAYKDFLSGVWHVYEELADSNTKFVLKDHLWKLFLYEKGLFQIDVDNNLVLDGCNCGVRHMTVLPDGSVHACRRFDSPVGKVPEQSFVDIFLGDKLNVYRQIDKLEVCKDCKLLYYCRGCHAVSHGTYGNYFVKDPQCWKNI